MIMYVVLKCERFFSGCVKLGQSDQNLCHSYEKSLTRSKEDIIEGEIQPEMEYAMIVPHEDDKKIEA